MAIIRIWYAPLVNQTIVAIGSRKSKGFSNIIKAKKYAINQSKNNFQRQQIMGFDLRRKRKSSKPYMA